MGERTEKVKRMIEKHKDKQKKIEKKYGTKKITEQIKEVDAKIHEIDWEIEKTQRKLSEVSLLDEDKPIREEYKKQLEGLEKGYFDKTKSNIKIEELEAKFADTSFNHDAIRNKIQGEIEGLKSGSEDVWVEGKNYYLEEKQRLENELQKRNSNKDVIEREQNVVDDKLRASLTQEIIAIDNEIKTSELEIQRNEVERELKYQRIKDFQYEYEEYEEEDEKENKVTKKRVVNQTELDSLNAEYEALQNTIRKQREKQKETLKDLQEAKALCQKELAVLKEKDAKKVKSFSKAWNDAKTSEEESKKGESKKKQTSKDEGKGEGEGKEKGQGEGQQGDEGQGQQGQNGDKAKWHPDLTEDQINELKAEGIEPGDPEYDTYLRNHGLDLTKQEDSKAGKKDSEEEKGTGKKDENANKKQWHPDLTENQINELKAEGIEPGDPEYDMYLRNYGLDLTKRGDNSKAGKKTLEEKGAGKKEDNEKEWHPTGLSKAQIDELKAEGIEPGDPEYDMYLKNQGIGVGSKCNIHIGLEGFISYNGQEYKISNKAIKDGVNIDSFNNKELEDYLKEEIGVQNEKGIETMKQLIEKGLIDMTIVHAIHSTNMPEEQKRKLIQTYEHKALYAQAGKKYPFMDMDIAYDMKDLSKAHFFSRLIGREVNSDEKEKIFKNATRAIKNKMGKIKGEYKPSLRERFLNRIAGKKPLAFPVEEIEKKTVKDKQKEFQKEVKNTGKEPVPKEIENRGKEPVLGTKATSQPKSKEDSEKGEDGAR